ncbi:hypothetical protein NAPIS_ORF00701 [Vairimorpha apis BRL 01]|uniref:Uncharacterized protein n=1 Tax=Vairimorpha apis BRL 01 TaxID=1037528 RepID=T0L2F7_9MICR|nr:hypothetical protein NAPIS_ORF00701 [Vairimorpha apis BRL 01]
MGIFENKSSESSLTGSPYTSTSPTQSSKHSTDIVSSSPDISVDLEENDNNNEINLINKSMEKEIAQISSSSTSSPTSSSDEINISDKIHNKKYQRKHISSEAKHVFDEAKFNLEKLTLIDELDNQHIAPLVKNIKSKSLDRFMFLSEDDLSQNNSEKSGRKRIIRNLSGSESSNRFKNIPSFNNKDEPFIENETDYKKNQSDISDSKSCVKTILDHEKNSIKDLFNNETEEKSNTVNFIDSLIKNYDYEDIVDKIVEKIYRSQEEQNLDDTDCIFDKKEDEKRENVEQLIPTQIFNNQEILSDSNNLEESKNVQESLDNISTNNFENITEKPYEQKQEYNSKTQRFIEFNESFDVVLDDEFKNLDDLPVAVQTKKLLESDSNYDDKNLYDTSILNDLIKKSEDDDLFAKELNDDLIKKQKIIQLLQF